jgi:hypothetical protein
MVVGGGTVLTCLAIMTAAADPVVGNAECSTYPGFSLVYCSASQVYPDTNLMGAPPTVPVTYRGEHYAYVETDGDPRTEEVTFLVKGRLGELPANILATVEPEALVFPVAYQGIKDTGFFATGSLTVNRGQGEYEAFASTSIGRVEDVTPVECTPSRIYTVTLE